MESFSNSYKEAGVDVTAGYKAVELMKEHVKKTVVPGVMSAIGGFGGLFELDLSEFSHPVLVSGTDGVGTKLKIAFLMDKHDTVGIDCVAMCVNDILCAGAKPLFFLDYIALGKNVPEQVADIVKGVADGCVMGGCGLIGGETAEMPGFYDIGEYDIAGFCVGAVNKDQMLDPKNVKVGDKLIGLASSGVHSNGYSLVRKLLVSEDARLDAYDEELGQTLGEALLTPTKIYVKPVLKALKECKIHAMSHITGGGFYENVPRMLPDGLRAKIEKNSFPHLPIFSLLQKAGKILERDMYNTFNMGLGMIIAVDAADADRALELFQKEGEAAYLVGEIVEGKKGVELW